MRWKVEATTGGGQGKREARSILRRTTSTWAPAGSDADRKPEIEEKRRSETKAIRRESSRAWRREERARIGTRESRRCREKCKIPLLPVGNSDRCFFLCCSNRCSTCHEKIYWRITFIFAESSKIFFCL